MHSCAVHYLVYSCNSTRLLLNPVSRCLHLLCRLLYEQRMRTLQMTIFWRAPSTFRAAAIQLVLHISAGPKARLYVSEGAVFEEFCDLSTNACARVHFPGKLLFRLDLSGLEFEVERRDLQGRPMRITRLLNALLK